MIGALLTQTGAKTGPLRTNIGSCFARPFSNCFRVARNPGGIRKSLLESITQHDRQSRFLHRLFFSQRARRIYSRGAVSGQAGGEKAGCYQHSDGGHGNEWIGRFDSK